MSFEIIPTNTFLRAAKRLRRKYRHIDEDIAELSHLLLPNPHAGDAVPGFEDTVYKMRVPSRDMKRGKSGGYRVIYYLVTNPELIYLLTIYAKAQKEDIATGEIRQLLNELGLA